MSDKFLYLIIGLGIFCFALTFIVLGMTVYDQQFGDYETYEFNDGEVVVCKNSYTDECGVLLYDCMDGIEYKCLTNVKEIGSEG